MQAIIAYIILQKFPIGQKCLASILCCAMKKGLHASENFELGKDHSYIKCKNQIVESKIF
jgi:hypothetical protein